MEAAGLARRTVVSVKDAAPLAIVHMPSPTLAPLTMAIGFLFIFSAPLLDNLLLFLIGAAFTGIAFVRWFWPQSTETRALEEWHNRTEARLPLATGGPGANGYWGTVVLILVLATALLTTLACYFYLIDRTSVHTRGRCRAGCSQSSWSSPRWRLRRRMYG